MNQYFTKKKQYLSLKKIRAKGFTCKKKKNIRAQWRTIE